MEHFRKFLPEKLRSMLFQVKPVEAENTQLRTELSQYINQLPHLAQNYTLGVRRGTILRAEQDYRKWATNFLKAYAESDEVEKSWGRKEIFHHTGLELLHILIALGEVADDQNFTEVESIFKVISTSLTQMDDQPDHVHFDKFFLSDLRGSSLPNRVKKIIFPEKKKEVVGDPMVLMNVLLGILATESDEKNIATVIDILEQMTKGKIPLPRRKGFSQRLAEKYPDPAVLQALADLNKAHPLWSEKQKKTPKKEKNSEQTGT